MPPPPTRPAPAPPDDSEGIVIGYDGRREIAELKVEVDSINARIAFLDELKEDIGRDLAAVRKERSELVALQNESGGREVGSGSEGRGEEAGEEGRGKEVGEEGRGRGKERGYQGGDEGGRFWGGGQGVGQGGGGR